MRGISIHSPITTPFWSGSNIIFADPSFGSTWQLAVKPEVYAWSSNYYSLSWVMDSTNSFCIKNGVEIPSGCLVNVGYDINENELRIILTPTSISDDEFPLDFPTGDSWYPISPDDTP